LQKGGVVCDEGYEIVYVGTPYAGPPYHEPPMHLMCARDLKEPQR
jgi:hypothetical protein